MSFGVTTKNWVHPEDHPALLGLIEAVVFPQNDHGDKDEEKYSPRFDQRISNIRELKVWHALQFHALSTSSESRHQWPFDLFIPRPQFHQLAQKWKKSC